MISKRFKSERLKGQVKAEKEIIEKYIKKDMKVLDLGCGEGRLLKEFLKKTEFVTGLDINPSNIEEAKKNFPNVKFVLGDLNNIDKGNEYYDVIISLGDSLALAHGKQIKENLEMLFKITNTIIFSFPPEEYLIREAGRRRETHKVDCIKYEKFYPDWNKQFGEGEFKTIDFKELNIYKIVEKKDIYFFDELARHICVLRRKNES